jgi:hypothetical protein
VPKEGLEPSHPKAQEPKSCVSANSTTPALLIASLAKARSARIALGSRLVRRRSRTKSVSARSFSPRRRAIRICSDSDKSESLHVEIPLELVDVTGGFHVVLSNRDSAVALLVDVDNKG